MRRRTIVFGGAASAMLAAVGVRAQERGRAYRIAMLMPPSGPAATPYIAAAREQLAKAGFVEGRNLVIDVRYPTGYGQGGATPAAREALALKPDAILAFGTAYTHAAVGAAGNVPVIFTWVADPLGPGFVKDLARPGGNVTGVVNRYFELGAKRLELLRELLPSAKRVAFVAGFFDAFAERALQQAQGAAKQLDFELVRVESGGAWTGVIDSSIQRGAQAAMIIVPFGPFGMKLSLEEVVRKSVEHRFPVIFADVDAVEGGGLLAYANRFVEEVRRAAAMVGRVLRGENPSEMAVDQSARFELAINLKTAGAIGLKIPQSLLLRADRVIE